MIGLKILRLDHREEQIREESQGNEADDDVFHKSKLLAPMRVEFADGEEGDHNCDVNDVRHAFTVAETGAQGVINWIEWRVKKVSIYRRHNPDLCRAGLSLEMMTSFALPRSKAEKRFCGKRVDPRRGILVNGRKHRTRAANCLRFGGSNESGGQH